MRKKPLLVAQLCAVAIVICGLPQIAWAQTDTPTPSPDGMHDDPNGAVVNPGEVAPEERDKLLGDGWESSTDQVLTSVGDENGFSIYYGKEAEGYAWAPVATLAEPGIETDRWIGNTCSSEDGTKVAAVYAPRALTNDETQFDAGAWGAIIDIPSGTVTKLGRGFSIAYFNPGCGTGNDVVFSAFSDEATTHLVRVDASNPGEQTIVDVGSVLTSAVPTAEGSYLAAAANQLVSIDSSGDATGIAPTAGVPYDINVTQSGGITYVDKTTTEATARSLASAEVSAAPGQVLATAPIEDLGIARGLTGQIFLTGENKTKVNALPDGVTELDVPTDSTPSSEAHVSLTTTDTVEGSELEESDASARDLPVEISGKHLETGEEIKFLVAPSGPASLSTMAAPPNMRAVAVVGDPNNPVETERTCAIPRNDPTNQAMQPKPRQVEWAVNQAVRNSLNTTRTSPYLAKVGLAGSTPQGMFPSIPLSGGGAVPSQVMLGILAQESNLWQASRYATPGVTGNPLVGNFYGNDTADATFTWTPKFSNADCGYGVAQVTDGMRLAGKEIPGTPASLPAAKQRAVALDYGTNIAAGLQILQTKWNQTRDAGMKINDGNPKYLENWFFAVWAYNTGFNLESNKAANNGAWGVGWSNNPVNPKYDQNRTPFLDGHPADASKPQNWPYPEKVMGFAAHSFELYEDATTVVSAFRPAWWTNTGDRALVKPDIKLFCTVAVNDCNFGDKIKPTDPAVSSDPAGPCGHKNAAGQYDLKCWYHGAAEWKDDCSGECGNELLRFSPGYAEQVDGNAFPPNCSSTATDGANPFSRGLPAGSLVVDDVVAPPLRVGCSQQTSNGSFQFTFGSGLGGFPSKIDTHQLGAGFNSHFYFAHTRNESNQTNLLGALNVVGKWTLNRSLAGSWTRVLVHVPDHGAWTQQAAYNINVGDGTIKTRVIQQRTYQNSWISLGVFQMKGVPTISLSNLSVDGDGEDDIAWDAVAFTPLPSKPKNFVVAMGDSFSSGEGASDDNGAQFYKESDNNGKHNTLDPNPYAYNDGLAYNRDRNGCHRASEAWSRKSTLPGDSISIGRQADTYNTAMDYHLIACSGAESHHLLAYNTATIKRTNAFKKDGSKGRFREVSQLDSGFLDENTTLVTLSIGGNDVGFSTLVKECVFTPSVQPCEDRQVALLGDPPTTIKAGVSNRLAKLSPSIELNIAQIHEKAPNARILLMGYPNIFEAGTGCFVTSDPLSGPANEAFLRKLTTDLTATQKALVKKINDATSGTRYLSFADPTAAFAGRSVCSPSPAINGVVFPLTPGDDPLVPVGPIGIISSQTIHPNKTGTSIYANVMSAALATAP